MKIKDVRKNIERLIMIAKYIYIYSANNDAVAFIECFLGL